MNAQSQPTPVRPAAPPATGMLFDPHLDDAFDTENPGVYSAFVAEADAVRRARFTHYSARTIVHVLRHHSALRDGSGTFKINDHISPYLARRLMRERPDQFAGFFETRASKSEEE